MTATFRGDNESGEDETALGRPRRRDLAFYACCRAIAVGLSHVAFPGRVIGRDRLPTGPYVLAPLHRSYVDWLIVARVTRRRLRYVVKGEVWSSRFFGRLLEALGAFPIHRGAADREALRLAVEVLTAGEPLVVFPEGTRGEGDIVKELRDGAAYLSLRAGVPIVPVGIAGAARAMPKGVRLPRPARVLLVVGAPIVPLEMEKGASRIARSATRATTEALRDALQQCSADAEGLLAARRDGASSSRRSRGQSHVPDHNGKES